MSLSTLYYISRLPPRETTVELTNMTRSTALSAVRPVPRRGLSRVEAAMYLGISPSKFDELRKTGRIGPAKILDGRKLYAVEILDEFFDALPDEAHDTVDDWTVSL